jgi:EmrB/QacA subfamily drug resistance transporter
VKEPDHDNGGVAGICAACWKVAAVTAETGRRRWLVLAVLCLSVLLVVVDNTIVNVALPTISRRLSASTQDLQWVVDAYALVFASLLLVGGNLGDRLGRRRILQAGLVLFALTSAAAGVAQTTGELIGARAAMGAAAALIYPATLALLTSTFTDARERATAIGIWSAVAGLAVAIGPVSGGLLLRHFSWRSVFFVSVPIAVIALVAGAWMLPESRDRDAGRFDPAGALLSVGGAGLLVWTVIEAPRRGWASAATLAGFAGSAVILAGFAYWEARRPDPMLDIRLFANARFSAASGAIALAFFGLFGFIFLITQYFQLVRGYDPLKAGVATLPFAVVTAVMSPTAIAVMKQLGTKIVVASGLLIMSAGFAVAATLSPGSAYWGPVIASMTLMAAGLALTTSPATDAIMGALPPAKAGAGSAVNDTTRELGGALGVAVIGSVMASVYRTRVLASLVHLGVPVAVVAAVRQSVAAGLAVAAHLPPALRSAAAAVTRQAFTDGMSAGSIVAAVATAAAAACATLFLPARAGQPRPASPPVLAAVTTGTPGQAPAGKPPGKPARPPRTPASPDPTGH